MNREKHAFFTAMERMQGESRERFDTDLEHRKRWLLKSMSGGFGRKKSEKPLKVSLPKMSWEKE